MLSAAVIFSCGLLLATASLASGQPRRWEVINAGIGGNNTADLLARVEPEVVAQRPDWVVLLAGTNDWLNSRNPVRPEQYRDNLGELVRRIKAAKAKVLLLTLPPVHAPELLRRHPAKFYGVDGPAGRVAAANAIIREVGRENEAPVADVFAVFECAGGATGTPTSLIRNQANSNQEDGVHPTPEGYRLIGQLVADTILRENSSPTGRIVCFGDSITRGVHVVGEGGITGETYPAFLLRALEKSNRDYDFHRRRSR